MHVRRRLTPLIPALISAAALAVFAAVTASPAAAGMATGSITDQYGNPVGGISVEALDITTGAQLAAATASDSGDFYFELLPPAANAYKVRLSDPKGVFITSYLYDRSSFEDADQIGYS